MTVNTQSFNLPFQVARSVGTTLDQWQVEGRARRLWDRDASLWTSGDESAWMDWLTIVERQRDGVSRFADLTESIRASEFKDVVLIGMGGSSLFPEVLAATFGSAAGSPRLTVLDSTDPAQIAATERGIDLPHTLFIVSSKSGTTLESSILMDYFVERMRIVKAADAGSIGSHFMAITDPGSKLEAFARESAFRNIFFGHAGIGGRFSALSDFGMIPAAVIGLNVEHLLAEADLMVRACGPEIAPARNPAVELGIVLARAALAGRDKITIAASGQIETFGSWLEQLLAESTGKDGKGVIPVDGEGLADPEEYSRDRLFVYLRLATAPDPDQDRKIAALEEAGHAVVRIDVATPESLAGELFRWELATAVAGVELGLNPFDQPDVEASKVATRELTTRYEASGVLPVSTPVFEWGAIAIFGGGPGARAASSGPAGLMDLFRTHLDQIRPGDYFAVLAYVERNTVTGDLLDRIRRAVRGRYRVATPVGFGPRFLHSSGQLYKGGPNSGVFLQITCDDSEDLPVPGRRYTFGVVKTAQAAGDLSVLDQRGRRWLRVHIRQDLLEGLEAVAETIEMALESSGG